MKTSLCALVAFALLANAAMAEPGDEGKADALFREARALMKAGDCEQACPKLEESYRLDPAAGTAVNLGDCFEKTGKVGSALLAYRDARSLISATDPRVKPVEAQIAVLEGRAPRLTITRAPGAPRGTKVKLDGRSIDAADFGKVLVVNPGRVVIAVEAPGREQALHELRLAEGQSRKVVAEVGEPIDDAPDRDPAPAPKVRTHTNSSESAGSQRTIGFIVGGAGVVALGVAGVFWLRASSKDQEATDAGCTSTTCPAGHPQELSDSADDARRTANWSAGLGALALAGGAVLVLTAPSGKEGGARLRFSPGVMFGGTGAKLGGTW